MLNEIARVFSSNGVLIPGSEAVPVRDRRGSAKMPGAAGGATGAAGFDQDAAKVEISSQGRELQKNGPRETGADGKPLSDEEKKQIHELEKRDREVRAHEAAHQAAAGGNARGGASFEYQAGPDGKQYAIGGHVDIDVSPVQGNPRATLQKAMTVQAAALAPADPSGQDRSVAAAAARMALEAQKELAQGGDGADKAGAYGAKRPNERGASPDSGTADQYGTGAGLSGDAAVGPAQASRIRSYGRASHAGAALSVYG
jgi:hypothetical protein